MGHYVILDLKISKGVGHTVTFVRSADRLLEYGRYNIINVRVITSDNSQTLFWKLSKAFRYRSGRSDCVRGDK